MPWTPRGDGQMPGERRRSVPSVVAVRASATHTGPHTMAALAQTARRPVSCARGWRTSDEVQSWNLQPDLQPLRWRCQLYSKFVAGVFSNLSFPSLSPCTGSRLPGLTTLLTRQGGKPTLQRPKNSVVLCRPIDLCETLPRGVTHSPGKRVKGS